MTNEEKIKNMSREELEILLVNIQEPYRETPFCKYPCCHNCLHCIIMWLDKEAEENV